MRAFILIMICCLAGIAYGQSHTKATPVTTLRPLIIIDSVDVGTAIPHLDPNKISNIYIDHYSDSSKGIYGRIYITTKERQKFTFLTISDILKYYNEPITGPVIFMLDHEFLRDTANFKMDASFFLKADVLKASEFQYLKRSMPGLLILQIKTRTKENLENENRIRIQGNETIIRN